jgi:hypothetical protein
LDRTGACRLRARLLRGDERAELQLLESVLSPPSVGRSTPSAISTLGGDITPATGIYSGRLRGTHRLWDSDARHKSSWVYTESCSSLALRSRASSTRLRIPPNL